METVSYLPAARRAESRSYGIKVQPIPLYFGFQEILFLQYRAGAE